MSLRYALLAILTAQPMTGYDLAKAFRASVGHVWHAPNSQIYPELRRMEKDGLVDGESVAWGTRGTKTQYTPTPSGLAAFREWMATPLDYALARDPAHLRAAYFEWTDPTVARAQLGAHLAHFEGLREQWATQLDLIRRREHPIVKRRLEVFPESEWDRIVGFKQFAYEGLVAQAEQEMQWARRGMDLVNELWPSDE